MKKIFIDCGTHLCEALNEFYNKGLIDDSFEIYTFEANPSCNIFERIKSIPLNIKAYNKAIWIFDGIITFDQENHVKSNTRSPSDGYSDIDGWCSSIDGIGNNYIESLPINKIQVECIDFDKFIRSLPEDVYIICKMDIEGCEFEVLRHIIKKGSILRINELHVEFHDRYMENEDHESKQNIIKQIEDFNIKFYSWS